MRLISLSYLDKESKWKCSNIKFDELTLLVGASGVGKTKILKAIAFLKELALGMSIDKSLQWTLEFEMKGSTYIWEGVSEIYKGDFMRSGDNKVGLVKEVLIKNPHNENSKFIFKRDNSNIMFFDKDVPKTASDKSLISIYSEEEELDDVFRGFRIITSFDFEMEKRMQVAVKINDSDREELKKRMEKGNKKRVFNALCDAKLPTLAKLVEASELFPEVFDEIKEEFKDIFETVEDIKVIKKLDTSSEDDEPETLYTLQLKEMGTDYWVNQSEISAGMYKTLLFIALIKLTGKNSVIILDEFENSLGINCIELVASELLNGEKQFITTSHHPYIINKISMKYWKIVTRKGSEVRVKKASDYKLGKSKHEAFKQLLNLPAYTFGSADE
ncbi:ATP-binding protein [Bacillus cereus]|uniref:ATP-binding protein n=1 Tax=Bacillus cereus group TaxID=86661 RepID=UPI0009755885|nr:MULTISPECIES: ATP-binding protein [Bacillus cereus group]EKS8379534.1 ATP-binding protein [Bacillus cereus]EKS8385379.1 ATP-binding protein [Bacillus cereus]EMA7399725.1 ATP-binding protein [Bacillus cereus]EMA7401308.1 ATP-binding protein [Bacillus cereus]OMH25019.1 hypothetical protein BUM91_28320 [Bacillus thuringiensis]